MEERAGSYSFLCLLWICCLQVTFYLEASRPLHYFCMDWTVERWIQSGHRGFDSPSVYPACVAFFLSFRLLIRQSHPFHEMVYTRLQSSYLSASYSISYLVALHWVSCSSVPSLCYLPAGLTVCSYWKTFSIFESFFMLTSFKLKWKMKYN